MKDFDFLRLFHDYAMMFVNGDISYQQFSQDAMMVQEMVDDVNAALDGTCILHDTARQDAVREAIKPYQRMLALA